MVTQDAIKQLLHEAQDLHKSTGAVLDRLQIALQTARQTGVECRFEAADPPTTPITEHRRQHRPGPVPRLDRDPELRAFVVARLDRMTFVEIEDAIAETFPPGRRVSKTTIHRWWQSRPKDRPVRGSSGVTHPG